MIRIMSGLHIMLHLYIGSWGLLWRMIEVLPERSSVHFVRNLMVICIDLRSSDNLAGPKFAHKWPQSSQRFQIESQQARASWVGLEIEILTHHKPMERGMSSKYQLAEDCSCRQDPNFIKQVSKKES